MILVSVPYRGATFLNTVVAFVKNEKEVAFPSPIGELHFSMEVFKTQEATLEFPSPIGELHFSIHLRLNMSFLIRLFPSPIGELHFSISPKIILWMCTGVSVPYRGATFLNQLQKSSWFIGFCFRPLSGSYISQSDDEVCLFEEICQFPSPIGELHFSIVLHQETKHGESCFRPLSGSYISQLFLSIVENGGTPFPSPIGELHFSI